MKFAWVLVDLGFGMCASHFCLIVICMVFVVLCKLLECITCKCRCQLPGKVVDILACAWASHKLPKFDCS